jgi:hypothetical protein
MTALRRLGLCLLVVTAILLVAEIRLSRGGHNYAGPLPPDLWANAVPPGRWAPSPLVMRAEPGLIVTDPSPAMHCATVVSIDLGSRYALTDVQSGVPFDIDADGDLDRVAWTEPGTDVAFLALDRDGDGVITSGRELIGNRTLAGVTSGANALAQLATGPGTRASLDADHPLFPTLRLWRDANHNGRNEARELRPADEELSTIFLGYEPHRRMDSHGNRSRFRGFVHVRTAPGTNKATAASDDQVRRRYMYEVCLVSQ